jgi:sec-independent protein translocase protein TatA
MGLGVWEVVLIVGVVLVFFGSRRLPQLAKSIGEAKKELKKSLSEDEIDVTDSTKQGRIGEKDEGAK